MVFLGGEEDEDDVSVSGAPGFEVEAEAGTDIW